MGEYLSFSRSCLDCAVLRIYEPVHSVSIASVSSSPCLDCVISRLRCFAFPIAPFRVCMRPCARFSIASTFSIASFSVFTSPCAPVSIALALSLYCVALALRPQLRISSRFSIASRLRIAFPFVAFHRAFHRVSSRSRPHTPLYPTTLTREALRLAPLRQTPADTHKVLGLGVFHT